MFFRDGRGNLVNSALTSSNPGIDQRDGANGQPKKKGFIMLELRNIGFSVPESDSGSQPPPMQTIIDNVTFTFEKGGFYAITGPNGSGKTTIAKLIMGINESTQGQIIFNGTDITHLPINERSNAGIVYGFQHPARFKGTTFRDLLSIALGTDDDNQLAEIIARVGVCSMDFLDKPVDSKLSGGEIKKIELATVIARNPQVAIYDEPDTGIDLWTIGPMIELLKREQADNNTTTIVVSHNKAFLEAADTLLLVKKGRIAYTGDLDGAMPMLDDLSICSFSETCEGENNAQCYR
jgi:Fe-S cluster assembly ATP-binding protein